MDAAVLLMDETAPVPRLLSIAKIGPFHGSRPHRHACWEIGFYLRGRGVARVGARQVPFAPGTLICYPPAIAHSERAVEACQGFFITAERCPFGPRDIPVCVESSRERTLRRLATLLHEEYRRREAHWEEAVQHLFDLLLLHVRRQCLPVHPTHPLAEALRAEIHRHAADPDFHVGAALARLPMSPDHLRRRFARDLGCNPHFYLQRLRVDRARRLLREGGWRVKEVAAQVGLPDEMHFSRLFLRFVGRRPGVYGRAADAGPAREGSVAEE